MKITFCCSNTEAGPWLEGLAAALQEIEGGVDISAWQPGAPQADYAVVWGPPQQFIDEQPALKAMFNIGAGVDGLLGLRLPPSLRVVRLEDTGMAVQMAEYVSHALIRHFRTLDQYEAQGVMNRGARSRLLPGAYVINVARGAHLVEEDLLALIDEGHVAGAALDVFCTEPLPAGHPFWHHPKIAITPHTSARTLQGESIAQIAGKIAALERGEAVAGVVDAMHGY